MNCSMITREIAHFAAGVFTMRKNFIRVALSVLLLSAFLMAVSHPALPQTNRVHKPDAVYVGTPYDVISILLQMAHVQKDDVLYDLGCGDGRVLVLAAQKYGCRGVGYEIDPERVNASIENVIRNRVEKLVKIAQADIFTLDLSEATVVHLYLLPEMNIKLLPQLDKMKPGTRVICHNYNLQGIIADKTLTYLSYEDSSTHIMALYTIPLVRSIAE
jgi:precorrin-6B methylase 2